jgi:ATP-dependent HslUV protease ATP-binding subunit HslU
MSLTPREIVSELDRYIIGQPRAKKSVAIALRNRWRRHQVKDPLKNEILPKNILMIGPTGVGKTEISRRLAKLSKAPFIKVEATKFTEIGYVGRDVEQIIRDLLDLAIHKVRRDLEEQVKAQAEKNAQQRLLDALVGPNALQETRQKFRELLDNQSMEDKEIEIEVIDYGNNKMPTFEVPGMPGAQMGMFNLGELLGKNMTQRLKKKMTVQKARESLLNEESDKLINEETVIQKAIQDVEDNGIVFLDEIDKICARAGRQDASVNREGVQRDLLPLIEGTNVSTKYGNVKTDHVLFIASGAFHIAKPSDLLPELQGRLPIRIEMDSLTQEDFVKILTEPESSLIRQYTALMQAEAVILTFTKDAIQEIAAIASHVNETVENIGARRLHTILEKVLEDISFEASERSGETLEISKDYVIKQVGELSKDADLSKFIL